MGPAHRTTGLARLQRLRGLTTRSGHGIRSGVLAVVTASALGLVVAAPTYAVAPDPTCCVPDNLPRDLGPHVFAASFSGGQLHETLTFHKPGQFVAHILSKQPTHLPLRGRTVSLGQQAAGKTHVSVRLGKLKPGGYAVVVTPEPQTTANSSANAASWVRFTVTKNGKVTNIKLITP